MNFNPGKTALKIELPVTILFLFISYPIEF